MSSHSDIGVLLAELREAAKLTQKQVAERLGVHQSRVSRLESGEEDPETADHIAFLKAVGTPAARKLKAALETNWKHLPQASLRHPDLEILIEAEAALDRLHEFKTGPTVPHVLAGQAELLFRRLYEFGEFLLNLEHRIAYVGELAVGKTTAGCRQTGLVVNPANTGDLKGMLLDTGGGRTTLCDVYIRGGDRFSIDVVPLADEEVYRLVDEFCRSVVARQDGASPTAGDFKLPEEVERALRNMAGLLRPTRRKGEAAESDPAAELASKYDMNAFKADVASRLALWRRTRRLVDFEGVDQLAGRRWLKDTFTLINNGRHPDFSMPEKITVTVPFSPVSETPFTIELVDTRGIDGSAIRPDLVGRLKDRRTVTILCSKWGSAPDPSLQELLTHVVETEADQTIFSRVAILVLARAGDALSMRQDSGDSALDTAEGYEIKRRHVEDALLRINLNGIDIEAFDAASDQPAELTEFLVKKIVELRAVQSRSAKATIAAIDQMLENVEKAQALATLAAVNNDLRIFGQRHNTLKVKARPVQNRLLDAVRLRHARTVWATTRRGGSFWNFDVYQHLGDGAAADAKRRSTPAIEGLREIIKNKLEDRKFESAHSFLEQLLDDASAWESEFVEAARHHAMTLYKPRLSAANEMWAGGENKYGLGLPNYREEVASALAGWFDDNEDLQETLDQLVQRAWHATFLKPLRNASGNSTIQEAAE